MVFPKLFLLVSNKTHKRQPELSLDFKAFPSVFCPMTNFLLFYLLVASSKDQLLKLIFGIAPDPGSWHHL